MAEIQSFTLNLENRGLMVARPGDVLPPGYLTNYLNLTADKSGFISSRMGTSRVSGTNLSAAVHSQGRILISGTAYTYQGAGTSLYRAFSSIASGFSGNPLVMREGGPDLAILPHEIIFDSTVRYKDNGTTTTGFGIAGPLAMAAAVAAASTNKTIDLFEYATNVAIQAAWTTVNGTITTTSTAPAQGTYAGNLAVNASLTCTSTLTSALNLNQFTTAGDSTNDDLIVIYIRCDQPTRIDEVRIMFDVDPATNDFAHNFYWKAITANILQLASSNTNTATQGLSDLVANSSLDRSQLEDDTRFQTVPPAELDMGTSQWTRVFVKKKDFVRVGTSTNDWGNVAAIRIQIKTTSAGAINLGVDGLTMQSGTDLNATDYAWIYRYKNEVTGTHSPFSPEMRFTAPAEGVTVTNSSATLTVRNPRDTQATHIEVYRRGGIASDYAYSTTKAVTSWTGTTTVTDSVADGDLGEVPDLTQVEMANLLQTPSQCSTSVRKTVNIGVAYTDYTAAVSDDAAGTYADLSALDTVANGDWLVVGADGPFRKILIVMDSSVNTNTSVMTVSYWDGTAWRAVLNKSDGTAAAGKTFAQSGTIYYDFPDDWEVSTIDSVAAYYVRISLSAALSAAVHVTEVRLSANFFDPTVLEVHNGRVWTDDAHHTDRVWYSERFAVEEFLETNFIVASSGGDPVVRPYALDDQLFVFTPKTSNRVLGSASDSFQPLGTGAETGLFSKWAICKGQGRIFYRALDGIYAMPASGFPEKISLQIDPLFHGLQGGSEANLQPIDATYKTTETLEFFSSKVYFGYTATNGTRYELIYDLETERWEQTDRPSTSYLRLDDVAQFYSGSSDGYVYLRDTTQQDQGSDINVDFRTQYLDFGGPQSKMLTEILLDADLAGATVEFYSDFDDGTGTPQTVTLTNAARGLLHFPVSDDTECKNMALRVTSDNDGVRLRFYKATFFYIVLPPPLTKVITDWDDLGYAGDKRLQQLQLEIDTNGSNVSVAVQVDGATTETITVNTTSRQVVETSLTADTIGHLVRLVITGTSAFAYYRHQFTFLRDPLQTTRYDTLELDFGYSRWKYIRRVWVAANTPATVTMTIYIDEQNTPYTTTFTTAQPTGSGWSKTEIRLEPGLKGKVFRFVFTTGTAFKLFLSQSDVEWRQLAGQRGYERARLASEG